MIDLFRMELYLKGYFTDELLRDIISENMTIEKMPITFYHGTCRASIELDLNVRKEYTDVGKKLLANYVEIKGLDTKLFPDDEVDWLIRTVSMSGSENYKYEYFFTTTTYNRAVGYADSSVPFGEYLGLIYKAYNRCPESAEQLDGDSKVVFRRFLEDYEKNKNSDKVILKFVSTPDERFRNEQGEAVSPILWAMVFTTPEGHQYSFRMPEGFEIGLMEPCAENEPEIRKNMTVDWLSGILYTAALRDSEKIIPNETVDTEILRLAVRNYAEDLYNKL